METFNDRATKVKKTSLAHDGKAPSKFADKPAEGLLTATDMRKSISIDLKNAVKEVEMLRTPTKDRKGVEINFEEYAKEKWGFASLSSFYECLGVDPSMHSISSFATTPDFGDNYRWLVPEVIREAIRLGLRKNPIYPGLIAAEESVAQPTVFLPAINMSDAMPKKMGELETYQTGTISFGQKKIDLQKFGMGLKVSDEVNQYVSLNVLSLFLQDMGVKMGIGLDNLAINCLINGDQADGSEAAPTIGVQSTSAGFAYYDLLRVWIRMGRIGRMPNALLSNENPALDILSLPEFKGFDGTATVAQKIKLMTSIPASNNYAIHGAMPAANQVMVIDPSAALIKFNASSLKVESERIVEKGLTGTYANMTTGFANLFRDARVIVDKSVAFSSQGFPSWMDVGATEAETFQN